MLEYMSKDVYTIAYIVGFNMLAIVYIYSSEYIYIYIYVYI